MKKLISFLLVFTALSAVAQKKIENYSKAELFKTDGEIYFALPGAASVADILTKIISIDRISGDTVYAYASKKEFDHLVNSGSHMFAPLQHPGDLIQPEMSDNPREVLAWNYYPTYGAYEEIMQQFATSYPDLCKVYNIGTLPSGRKLLVARISDNVGVEEDEPEFLYTSSMHGDETTGYVLMLHLIDYLLTNYGLDARVTQMVNEIDLWINPLANPDGTYFGGNNSVNGSRRYNANYVDLNRNYHDPEDGLHPDGNAWQPETLAFMAFAEGRNFVMSANFHGGAEVMNYPWDTWYKLTADDNWWKLVCREYADTAHVNAPSGYMSDYQNGITNGAQWYSISGGRQDYMNYFQQCREVTIEISNTKLLPASQLLNFWNYNYRSLLNYIEQVTYGVRGTVTDSLTGEPLKAMVLITGFDKDSSMVFSSLPVGNYHRMLKAGVYNLTFSAEGYLDKTIHNVSVTDFSTVRLDVKLYDGFPLADFSASQTNIPVGGDVQFTDQSIGGPHTRRWTFEGGNINSSGDPQPFVAYMEPGTWDVSLFVENSLGSNTLIKPDYITVTPDYYIGVNGGNTCNARFYDSQGPEKDYKSNENLTTTFVGTDPNKAFRVHFTAFDVQPDANCSKDALYIYDGPDNTFPLIGKYCGNTIPDDVLTSVGGGAITFVFVSDEANNYPGWTAELTCDSGVGTTNLERSPNLSIYPNPSAGSGFFVESPETILNVEITDLMGKSRYFDTPMQNKINVDALSGVPGIYVLKVTTATHVVSRKLVVAGSRQ